MRIRAPESQSLRPRPGLKKRSIAMFEIVRKQALNPTVTLMEIAAPLVARKA